jgi:hypothetical protein
MAIKNSQIADQSIKGVVLGAVAWALVKWNIDAEAQAVIITVSTSVLAYASTKVGDKKVASFLAKVVAEAPKVVAEVKEEVAKQEAKKAPAKKAPAKKAQAKSTK